MPSVVIPGSGPGSLHQEPGARAPIDLFVSYRRRDGATAAQWVRRALLEYVLPESLRQRSHEPLEVYQDVIYERANENFYTREVLPALERSRFLLVIVTRAAFEKRSDGEPNWVEREIEDFLRIHGPRDIFVAMTFGDLSGPLPAKLEQRFGNIQRLDLRGLSLLRFLPHRYSRLRNEVLKVVASLRAISPEEMPILREEEARLRARRLAWLAGVASTLVMVLLGLVVWSVVSLREASRQLTENHLTQARAQAQASPARAQAHLVRALELTRAWEWPLLRMTAQARLARAWLGRQLEGERPVLLWHEREPVSACFDAQGRRVLTLAQDGVARVWDSSTGALLARTAPAPGDPRWAVFARGGTQVVVASRTAEGGRLSFSSSSTGEPARLPPMTPSDVHEQSLVPRRDLLVIEDEQHRIVLWDAASGEQVGVPLALPQGIKRMAVNARGSRLAAVHESRLQLWDTEHGVALGPSHPFSAIDTALTFSPDGSTLAVPVGQTRLLVLDAQTGHPRGSPLEFPDLLQNAKLDADGRRLLVDWYAGGESSAVGVYAVDTGTRLFPALRLDSLALAPEFTPDGKGLIITTDRGVTLWDAETGERRRGEMPHARVSGASFSSDRSSFATFGFAGARVWNLPASSPQGRVFEHEGLITEAWFSPSGDRLLTVSRDRTVRVWPLTPAREALELVGPGGRAHAGSVMDLAISPDGQYVVSVGDGGARRWRLDGGGQLGEVATPERMLQVQYRGDGRMYLAVSGSEVVLVDALRDVAVRHLPHPDQVVYATFSPDGTHVATACKDGRARVWITSAATEPVVYPGHTAGVSHVAFSPDGLLVASSSLDGTVQVWDAASAAPLPFSLPKSPAMMAVFSADGKRLATARAEGARVWELRTGHPLTEPLLVRDGVRVVAFSPDGQLLLSAGVEPRAQLWELESGRPVGAAMEHVPITWAASFSPGGERVLTGGFDGRAAQWDATTGDQLGPALTASSQVMAARYTPDGTRAAVGTAVGRLLVWDTRPAEGSVDTLKREAAVRSALTVDDVTGTVRMLSAPEWQELARRIQH